MKTPEQQADDYKNMLLRSEYLLNKPNEFKSGITHAINTHVPTAFVVGYNKGYDAARMWRDERKELPDKETKHGTDSKTVVLRITGDGSTIYLIAYYEYSEGYWINESESDIITEANDKNNMVEWKYID